MTQPYNDIHKPNSHTDDPHPPGGHVIERELQKLQALADWMDSKFVVPGTKIRFGLDSILGLIPGVGDTAGAAVTAYIIARAHKYNVPFHIKMKMGWNAFIDWLIGLIPFFGVIFDVGFKANRKNVALLIEHLKRHHNTMV